MSRLILSFLILLLGGCVSLSGNKTAREDMFLSSKLPQLEVKIEPGFDFIGSINTRPDGWSIIHGSSIMYLYADVDDKGLVKRLLSFEFRHIGGSTRWAYPSVTPKEYDYKTILGGSAWIGGDGYTTFITITSTERPVLFVDEFKIIKKSRKVKGETYSDYYAGKEYHFDSKTARATIKYYETVMQDSVEAVVNWKRERKKKRFSGKYYYCFDYFDCLPNSDVETYLADLELRADKAVQTTFSNRFRCSRSK